MLGRWDKMTASALVGTSVSAARPLGFRDEVLPPVFTAAQPARPLPPTVALSRLVNSLKGVSSRRLRQEFPELTRHYWQAKRLWSGSYFAGSVGGAPLNVLRVYIEQQRRPHDAIHPRPERRSPLAEDR
jgi:Transposase IS200 like